MPKTSPTFLKFTFQGQPTGGDFTLAGVKATDILVGFEGYNNHVTGALGDFYIVSDNTMHQNLPYDESTNTFVMVVLRWP